MAKHSPGPWAFKRLGTVVVRVDDADGATVLHCDAIATSVREANAHLIAAAPELLAACEEALVWADSDGLKDRLRAAIAKAKGNQP